MVHRNNQRGGIRKAIHFRMPSPRFSPVVRLKRIRAKMARLEIERLRHIATLFAL